MCWLTSLPRSTFDREESSLSTRPRKLVVLARLALRSERRATGDRLIGVFRGDRDEDRARNSLSDAITHLRRVLGRDAVGTLASELIVADDAPLTVDALELTTIAARGYQGKVDELYYGPFLDGLYIAGARQFDEWHDRERGRLERLFVKRASVGCAVTPFSLHQIIELVSLRGFPAFDALVTPIG